VIRMYHLNFHTHLDQHIFLAEEIDAAIRRILRETLREHEILSLALEVMPNHVHLILADFPDKTRSECVRLLKGVSARRFLQEQPEFREAVGNHLWQEGYDWTEITTHRQFVTTLRYVRENRKRGGLE
jgi:putative transposase